MQLDAPPRPTMGQRILQIPSSVFPLNPQLHEVHSTFKKWMGNSVDVELLDIIMATASANRMRREPVWLMIVGASGAGKTTMANSLGGLTDYVEIVSSLSSEGALLSAQKPKSKEDQARATGGLLRKLGNHGMIVFKDFTTILSMDNRAIRPQILAALRELHDGYWARKVGADGGNTLEWKGHLGIIGCCTTSWDRAYSAISMMGDRFIVARPADTEEIRYSAGMQAMRNLGKEQEMAYELRECVRSLISRTGHHMKIRDLPSGIMETLFEAATIASMARTAVEHDYRGKAEHIHNTEVPARFVKGLLQLIQGAIHIGISTDRAFNLAMRCIRDSIPPMRLRCLSHLMTYAHSTVGMVADAISAPWNTVDRALGDLHGIGLLSMERSEKERSPKFFSVKPSVNLSLLWTEAQVIEPPSERDNSSH